jgi:hypothetical protein
MKTIKIKIEGIEEFKIKAKDEDFPTLLKVLWVFSK